MARSTRPTPGRLASQLGAWTAVCFTICWPVTIFGGGGWGTGAGLGAACAVSALALAWDDGALCAARGVTLSPYPVIPASLPAYSVNLRLSVLTSKRRAS